MSTTDAAALWRVLQFSSATLPIGAFGYSGGLEGAVELGLVKNAPELEAWIAALIEQSLVPVDMALLHAMLAAARAGDTPSLCKLAQRLRACKDSAELREQDQALGRTLARLACDLGIEAARPFCSAKTSSHLAVYAVVCAYYHIGSEAALTSFLFSSIENTLQAAIKLSVVGQTHAQKIQRDLAPKAAGLVKKAMSTHPSEVGSLAFGASIASASHQTQYSRLFRS